MMDLWDRSSPAIEIDFSLPGQRVERILEGLRLKGRMSTVHVDNGPEFTSKALDSWA